MSFIPRVTGTTRERVVREFDELGPQTCLAEIRGALMEDNPEVLDMMSKCARDVGPAEHVMVGFAMFYRLLHAEALIHDRSRWGRLLPRVAPETRALIVEEIDEHGPDRFTLMASDQMLADNPELMHMADLFASRHGSYLPIMQGFCLVYRSIALQSAQERQMFN